MSRRWSVCWNELKNFRRQCQRKPKKVSKVYALKYLYKNYELSRKKKMFDSDLCDNELSDFKNDENRSVEKIVEIMKTLKLHLFEPEQKVSEIDIDERDTESLKEEGSFEKIL